MASVIIKMRIGGQLVEFHGKDLLDAIQTASPLSEMPARCGGCSSENIALSHRTAKGYDFYQLRCRDCSQEFALGQRREDNALFPKGPWQVPPRGGQADHDAPSQRPPEEPPPGHGRNQHPQRPDHGTTY